MYDTCHQILSLSKSFGLAAALVQVACIIAIVWAARAIPNAVRKRKGRRGLLVAMLPGTAWKATCEESEVQVVELARQRFHLIFAALLICVAARVGAALLVLSCL